MALLRSAIVRWGILLAVAVGVGPVARGGHELPVYPSYYPHEIAITVVGAKAAAGGLRDGMGCLPGRRGSQRIQLRSKYRAANEGQHNQHSQQSHLPTTHGLLSPLIVCTARAAAGCAALPQ